jgi:hypothetical protein
MAGLEQQLTVLARVSGNVSTINLAGIRAASQDVEGERLASKGNRKGLRSEKPKRLRARGYCA